MTLEAENARLREAIRIASILVEDDMTTPAVQCLQAALDGTEWRFGSCKLPLLPAAPPAPAPSDCGGIGHTGCGLCDACRATRPRAVHRARPDRIVRSPLHP